MEKVYHFQMDVFRKMKLPSMVFVSGDTVCGFLIEILSNGEILLLDGLQVKLTSRLPSGKTSTGACEIRGNKAAFCLQSTELEEVGRVIASLQLYQGEERLSTMQFFYTVDESLLSGDVVESESQKRLFDELVSDMTALKKVIPTNGEAGQILTKTEDGTAWQSVEGLKGEVGEQGPSGEPGEKGDPGKSAYDLWKESGNEGTLQEFLDSLRGLPGPPGEKGPRGEKGETGLKGEKGQQGLRGERGETGANGPQGLQGQAGERGQSAYDIWRAEGNSGSVQDFLNSLKGERGPRGLVGPAGMMSVDQVALLESAVKNGGNVQQIKYEKGRIWIFDGISWHEVVGGGSGSARVSRGIITFGGVKNAWKAGVVENVSN